MTLKFASGGEFNKKMSASRLASEFRHRCGSCSGRNVDGCLPPLSCFYRRTTGCELLPPSDGCWFQTIARKVNEKFHLIGYIYSANISFYSSTASVANLKASFVEEFKSGVYFLDWTPEMNQIVSASQQDTLS
ncbi:hypothetical protein HID58_024624 [Brassica napus]|uniref:Uncharacterized protein n=1 Tax=Brassica napus TaxID=3708 RepID=A0ABQ8CIR7_BRANA|nr:hypothetical protein HID58_024624 [Brassica napus]